jgi:hypothetical protein
MDVLLDQKLLFLEDRGFIVRKGKSKHYHYFCSVEYFHQIFIDKVISQIKSYKTDTIYARPFSKKKVTGSHLAFFGIPPGFISVIDNENNHVTDYIQMICIVLEYIQKKGPGGPIDFYLHMD